MKCNHCKWQGMCSGEELANGRNCIWANDKECYFGLNKVGKRLVKTNKELTKANKCFRNLVIIALFELCIIYVLVFDRILHFLP